LAETTTMRPRVLHALRALDAMPVENFVYPGTPDVNYVEGWVELKWLREWPAREGTVVEVDHFTPQQRVWHIRRARAGGNNWLLLQVRDEWLLFRGEVAAKMLGRVPRAELVKNCSRHWRGLDERELATCLLQPRSACSSPAAAPA
jgi:hypothetical protein